MMAVILGFAIKRKRRGQKRREKEKKGTGTFVPSLAASFVNYACPLLAGPLLTGLRACPRFALFSVWRADSLARRDSVRHQLDR